MVKNTIYDIAELENRLSEPKPRVVESLSRIPGDIMVLGAGGKMGPSLAHMARRASNATGGKRRVIGVSRFSNPSVEADLNYWGVETIRGDLLDPKFVNSLPDVPNLVYMAGFKFGTAGNPSLTWATNVYLPSLICQRFTNSRIAAFSSGNVYGPIAVVPEAGSVETDRLNPLGEYGMSVVGRERLFEYFSQTMNTQMSILRLNYATEMRYGVLVDLATQVFQGKPIDLASGYVNVIWQGDANSYALCSLEHASTPPMVLNMTGTELIRCRDVCQQFANKMSQSVSFRGTEGSTAMLSNAGKAFDLYGPPEVSLEELIHWTADWICCRKPTANKPTHFEVTDGMF